MSPICNPVLWFYDSCRCVSTVSLQRLVDFTRFHSFEYQNCSFLGCDFTYLTQKMDIAGCFKTFETSLPDSTVSGSKEQHS